MRRGGLIHWADTVGAAKVEAKLSAFAKMVGLPRQLQALWLQCFLS